MHASNRIAARYSQRGVALALLVWFIAAMSLLVAGVVMQARVDIKQAQLHAAKARSEALADGAIALALARAALLEQEGELPVRSQLYFLQPIGDFSVQVTFTPLTGLVDLNQASEELLYSLLLGATNIDENGARELANSVVEWRSPGAEPEQMPAEKRHGRFEAVEDLLLVPGIDRAAYESLRDSLYVSQKGQATVDWLSAPLSVLQSLGMSGEESLEYIQARAGEDAQSMGLPDTIDPSFWGEGSLPTFRADAVVVMDDTNFLRRRWVDRARRGADGLPWHFFHTEAVRAVSSEEAQGLALQEALDAGI